ncbi:hypothetical protein [uncultured Paracoccus sp.]|uniref:hypothetical protein n=1 Tax=uncultured Paracoccus sp. TaxID=189685 RepID=UPI0025FE413F|nr:hypothetical protein [uncultured Paracoccus sp.]
MAASEGTTFAATAACFVRIYSKPARVIARLALAITDLMQRLEGMRKIDVQDPMPIMDQRRRYQKQAEELALYLTQTYGAKIRHRPAVDYQMTMLGIRTTCTSGLGNLFGNWIAAAQRKLTRAKALSDLAEFDAKEGLL